MLQNNNNSNSLSNKNIAGMPRGLNNLGNINKAPNNIMGINKMPTQKDPFSKVKIDRQRSMQIMNSSGENIIRNKMNKTGGQ